MMAKRKSIYERLALKQKVEMARKSVLFNFSRKIDYNYLVNTGGKILVYMGISQIENIKNNLIKNGMKKNTKISIITNATLENQVIYNTKLKDVTDFVNDNEVKPPSIIIIN